MVDPMRILEREIFGLPETDVYDEVRFPYIEESRWMYMEEDFYYSRGEKIKVYVYLNKQGPEPFVDFYVWDAARYEAFSRYVFLKGHRLSLEEEELLEDYICDGPEWTLSDSFWEEVNAIKNEFPWVNLGYSAYKDPKNAVLHFYYAMQTCGGPREILAKCGLDYVVRYLKKTDYNILGTTPTMILGHGASMKLLKILNDDDKIDELLEPSKFEVARTTYKKYASYMNGLLPQGAQWSYLKRLSCNSGLFGGESFERALYNRLARADESDLSLYEQFVVLRRELREEFHFEYPALSMIEDVVSEMETLKYYLAEEGNACTDSWDELIRMRKKAESKEYEHVGEEFSCILPPTALELIREGVHQRNCVFHYLSLHADNDTTILFIRKNHDQKESYVTMEVQDHCICQVLGKFNTLPDENCLIYVEQLAMEKGWEYEPEMVLLGCVGDDCEIQDRLDHYFEGYYERKKQEEMKIRGWAQLTLHDAFPTAI